MNNQEQALKLQAKRLREALSEQDVKLGHRKVLDLVSRAHGWRNWNTVSALLDQDQLEGAESVSLPESPAISPVLKPEAGMGRTETYLHTSMITAPGRTLLSDLQATPETLGKWTRLMGQAADEYQLGGSVLIFIRSDPEQHHLYLSVADHGLSAEVTNVLPAPGNFDPITVTRANELESEWLMLLRPHLPEGIKISQRGKQALRDLLTSQTYALLVNHSANRSTGHSHSNDKTRWLRFVAAAAGEGLTDSDEHRRLVQEALLDEGFAARHAVQMAQDFTLQIEMARILI